MADNNKTITIGAKVDPNVKTVFASLEKEIAKANKTLGAGTAANPGMAKNLREQKDALLSIKKIGIDAFKTLAQEAERAASKEQTAFGRMKKYISELKAEYMGLSAAQKAASGVQTQGRGANFQPQITRWSAGQGAYGVPPVKPPSPPIGGPPGGGNNPGPSGKPQMSPSDIALLASAIGTSVAGVISRGANLIQDSKNMDIQMSGQAQQMVTGRFLNRALQGNMIDSFLLNNAPGKGGSGQTSGQMQESVAGGTKASWLSRGAGVIGNLFSAGGNIATATPQAQALASGGGGPGYTKTGRGAINGARDAAGNLIDAARGGLEIYNGAPDLDALKSKTDYMDAIAANNPFAVAANDLLQQEKHMRASQSRHLMGQHGKSWGLGAGFGYGRSEAGGIAESLQRMGGMKGMWDTYSTKNGPSAGEMMWKAMGGDPTMRPIMDEAMNKPTSQRSVSGRGLFRSSMELAAAGHDMGTAQGALSSIFQSGGGRDQEGSMRVLERAIARGTTAGFTDPRAQDELIGALGQATQGRILDGTSSLDRLANLMMGGKGNGTVAEAGARNSAMQGFNNLASNPYINGKQLAFAKTITDSQIQAEYLGRATVQDLGMGVKGNKRMADVGVTDQMMKKTLQYTMYNMLSSVSGISPELQAALKAGGPIDEKVLSSQGFGRMKEFDTDQKALAAARQYNATFSDLDAKSDRRKGGLPNYTDAVAPISAEEKTKQMLEPYIQQIQRYMANQDKTVEALANQLGIEKDGTNNWNIKNQDELYVRVIGRGKMATPPTNGVGKGDGMAHPTPQRK